LNLHRTLIVLLLFGTLLGLVNMEQMNQIQVYNQVLRLHVIANSDSRQDQALKLKVKDRIVTLMRKELDNVRDVEEARNRTRQCLPLIQKTAQAEIKNQGYDYPVRVLMGEYEFPTKLYGDMVFPQGRYEAVRVIIGEGRGHNWWCVLFPPLCLVSSQDQGLTLNADSAYSGYEVRLKLREIWKKEVRVTTN